MITTKILSCFTFLQDTQEEDMQKVKEQCTMGIFKEGTVEWEKPADIIVVLEGVEVLTEVTDVATACMQLFGCIYAMNLSYPTNLKYFWEVIQKVVMGLELLVWNLPFDVYIKIPEHSFSNLGP